MEEKRHRVAIASYQEAQRAEVIALWRSIFPDDPPWNEPGAVIDAKLGVDPELLLVACLEARVVGTAMGGYDGHRGWVYSVAVDPAHRRQGIAADLMAAVESALRALGCVKLNLQVRSTNAAVVSFYESIGYSVEERISMGKRLT